MGLSGAPADRERLHAGPVVLGSQTVRAFGSAYNFGQVTHLVRHLSALWLACKSCVPLLTARMLQEGPW